MRYNKKKLDFFFIIVKSQPRKSYKMWNNFKNSTNNCNYK